MMIDLFDQNWFFLKLKKACLPSLCNDWFNNEQVLYQTISILRYL